MDSLIKLLVIDDDAMDRLHLKRTLNATGLTYELTECESPGSISDTIHQDSFDCIFLDYLLPGDNGLRLLQKIRTRGVKTPVVIITSQGNESIAVELMKAGASDYIVKGNINSQSIIQVIRNMLHISTVEKEREAAEKALRVSESRLAEAQHIAKIGNWEFSLTDYLLYWSDEVYNIFDVKPGVFIPSIINYIDFIHADDRDIMRTTIREARKGKPFKIDLRVAGSGELKYIHMQGHPLKGTLRSIEKIVGTLQDITERKLAEQEILKTRELAEVSMKAREVFLTNMSHEIRTPMNAILGFTKLLHEFTLSSEQKVFLDAIHFSGENLLVIINDILDLSKIRSGKMTIEKNEFDLYALVKGCVTVLKLKAQEKNLELTYDIDPSVPRFVKGDSVRLNQVLVNLMSNAIKFTAEGSIRLIIRPLDSENEITSLTFTVSDTGIGIPEDKHALIFESFEQASSDTTRKYGGTGLGLAIVKSIVELQSGTISLVSSPEHGSAFTVQLPFEPVSQRPLPLNNVVIDGAPSDSIRGVSVLLVEDNDLNQLLAIRILERAGCIIGTASNGREALEKLKTGSYAVILMDIQMPEMDGYEATKYIRSQLPSPLSEIPIIAMTAHAFSSDIVKCLSVGMNDYISKPFAREALLSKIAKHAITPTTTFLPETLPQPAHLYLPVENKSGIKIQNVNNA